MNKIILDDELKNIIIDKNNELFFSNKSSNAKNINITIKKDTNVIINEINYENTNNIYNYYLEDNSTLIINKFYINEITNEINNIYLNGINSKSEINISCISKKNHSYILNIYHNNKNTISYSNVHGITLNDQTINIENNGYIKKGSTNSILNQDNKVITMYKNNSIIKPNLFIDEYNSYASHGAYIGKFDEEIIFYLQSRGINIDESNKLLTKGLLLNHIKLNEDLLDDIKEKINKELEVK